MSSTLNIDDEWTNFLSKNYNDDSSDCENNNSDETIIDANDLKPAFSMITPEPTPIYISTKSKIAYLLAPIDLSIFWDIPIIPYSTPSNGVIKKQIKFNSKTPE